jgi:alpha-L-rhamnosidase
MIYKTIGILAFVGMLSLCKGLLATERAPAAAGGIGSSLRLMELKTEHVSQPLGIDTPHPRFRWLLDSAERGQLQSGYQILVGSSLQKLKVDTGDIWDSGKVISDNSVEVLYGGPELSSGERAHWKVRVWDQNGRQSEYSAPAWFEMGLLHPSDWQAKWIAAKKGISSPLFRREFSVNAPVRRARAYVSGLGCYELFINGRRIGDRVLDPAATYYNNAQPFKLGSRVLYATYDVTNDLQEGANVIGVVLGHGWYSGEADAPGREVIYGDRPKLLLQLNVELSDGRRFSVSSDAAWRTHAGPIIYNDLANGERYDARLEQPGWDKAGFNDSGWENASKAEAPSGTLTAQLLPPAKVIETRSPARVLVPTVTEGFDNAYVYDFGQNFSGWARITVSGPRGASVRLRYAANIYSDDDTLDNRSNMLPDESARQEDTYILKGSDSEVWEPRFTLHGFRYVEIRSFTDTPIAKVDGRFVRSALESSGSFVSSNDLINRIHHNIQWTFMSSLQGIMQDAADRAERIGYLGDPGFVAEDYIDNYDMVGFWEKWLDDIQDTQKEDGDIAVVSPSGVPYRYGWPAWQSTYPILVWYLYEHYADRGVVEKHYRSLTKLVDHMSTTATDHIISGGLGDHMEPQENGHSILMSQRTPIALTSTAYFYYCTVLVSRMAVVLGESGDARRYTGLAQGIKDAFNARFFNTRKNQYAAGTQAANALAIDLGLAPPEKVTAVVANLIEDIVHDHDYHFSGGIVGSNATVEALSEQGHASLLYRVATQTTYPSLGYQVSKGATTVCETYECGAWLSQNMKMFGNLDKFFYRDLAGIRLASPGYRKALIQPQPVGDLRTVSASQQTVRGRIDVEWVKGNGYSANGDLGKRSFVLNVSIPAGMEADVLVPTLGWTNVQVTESGAMVWKSNGYVAGTPGLTSARGVANAILFHAGSGSYRFTVDGTAF